MFSYLHVFWKIMLPHQLHYYSNLYDSSNEIDTQETQYFGKTSDFCLDNSYADRMRCRRWLFLELKNNKMHIVNNIMIHNIIPIAVHVIRYGDCNVRLKRAIKNYVEPERA